MRLRASFPAVLLGFWLFLRSVADVAGATTSGSAALILLAAFALPVLPLERILNRFDVLRIAALLLVIAGASNGRTVGAAIGAAGGALFLFAAVGHVDRRAVMFAAGCAFGLHHLTALAPAHGVDTTVVARAAAVALFAALLLWMRKGAHTEEAAYRSYERRAGGMRLRGALVLGFVLYIQLVVLAPLVPGVAAAAGTGAFGAALLLATAPAALGASRRLRTATAAAAATGTALLNLSVPVLATTTLVVFIVATTSALSALLLAVSLQPAGGRRPGSSVAAGLAMLPGLIAWSPQGAGLAATLLVLPAAVALMPRSIPMRGALRRG
jgi:hypothetical protein